MAEPASASGPAFRAGLTAIAPVLVGLVPFALVLGAQAAGKGISPLEMAAMSALVFAGGSQFLAVELWRQPVPVALLTLMALLVNSRHVLMGAALVPLFRGQPAARVYPALYFMADEVWALTLAKAPPAQALPFYAGLATGLWLNWVLWTVIGTLAGALVREPARFGLDFAFVAVFVVLLRGMWRGPRAALPWLASAGVAALVRLADDGPWYVPLGALAGLAVAALVPARRP